MSPLIFMICFFPKEVHNTGNETLYKYKNQMYSKSYKQLKGSVLHNKI